MATFADSFLADLDDLSDNKAQSGGEENVDAANMEEDNDGEMTDLETLIYDDLDSVSKLQKAQRYIDIMQMETRQHNATPITGETTEKVSVSNGTFDKTDNATPPKIPSVYKEDVVRCNKTGLLGIVTGIAGDSDSESEDSDEDEDDTDGADEEVDENEKGDDCNVTHDGNAGVVEDGDNEESGSLPVNQVKVIWMDDSEKIQSVNDITVVDRGFMHGDYIASASEPTGQVGLVVDVNISVDLLANDGSTTKDVSSRDLKRVRDLASGDYVVLGPWLGRVDDVSDNVTVLFADGSVCKVMRANPMHLVPVKTSVLDDGNFPYYPGQAVKASSSTVLKNARWLSGLWKANRLEGTVTKVTAGSVFVRWITSAGYGPDSSIAPAEEQSPKNLKHLSCFGHANWKLGDWCLLPSKGLSCPTPLSKDLPESDLNENESDNTKLSSAGNSEMTGFKESNVKNDSMDHVAVVPLNGTNSNIELNVSPESSTCTTSLQVSKENVNESRPLHRKKVRKVVVRRDKKTRKKEENFERALVISNIKTRVDVAWQDGTIERGLLSTTLIPIDTPGDHEFVAEQYVMEKASDDIEDTSEVRRVGVVRSVNAKERTACVRWLKSVSRVEDLREFEQEEIVSVYELEGHIDYDYCYGDVVVRLSPVTVCTEPSFHGENVDGDEVNMGQDEAARHLEHERADDESTDANFMDFSDLSWVGNITGLHNGDIEVTWADGMVSTVGPQAIYVIVRDDDESIDGGTEASDDAASWETVDDDNEVDTTENLTEGTVLNHELEEEGENNSRRNGNMLAALEFVARVATGIFSLGRKRTDIHTSGSELENDIQSEGAILPWEKGASSDDSRKSSVHDHTNVQNAHGQAGENLTAETNAIAEAINDLRLEVQENLAGFHDACGFKRFDISRDPVDHHFIGESGQKSNERKWLKKVQQDWSILQNNLPDGIYVRVYEDRMDLLRAVIVGAYGTPYQDGLFFFDFHLPPEYPSVPPSAYYHSGGWRINPNLYEEGKVCLSLLNTWHGKGNEVWDHASSSILQVLVSLQGLVLNSKPYFNEAGYDRQVGTAEGEKNSLSYNENTFLLNCKTMMFLIRRPPKDFEDLVKDHFKRHGYYILKACDAYMKGCLIGSLNKDASISENSDSHLMTSVGFKLMLAKILPKLLATFNDIGVDCSEFKDLNQS